VLLPAGWDDAKLTFEASQDGVSYGPLYDKDGEVVTGTLVGGEYAALNPLTFFAVRFLKVRSGTSGTPVTQTADRTLTLIVRKL
jgi:hypothetical protein